MGSRGEVEGREALQDFGESFKSNNDAERTGGVLGWFAWFFQDDAIGPLQGLGVISMDKERSEKRSKEPFIRLMDTLPDRVGDTPWPRDGSAS